MFQHFTYCGCQDESFELFNSFTAEKTTVNVTQQTQQSTEAGIATVCLLVYILPKIRPSKLIMEQQWRQNGNWTYSTMSMSLYLHKHFYTSPFPKKTFQHTNRAVWNIHSMDDLYHWPQLDYKYHVYDGPFIPSSDGKIPIVSRFKSRLNRFTGFDLTIKDSIFIAVIWDLIRFGTFGYSIQRLAIWDQILW